MFTWTKLISLVMNTLKLLMSTEVYFNLSVFISESDFMLCNLPLPFPRHLNFLLTWKRDWKEKKEKQVSILVM